LLLIGIDFDLLFCLSDVQTIGAAEVRAASELLLQQFQRANVGTLVLALDEQVGELKTPVDQLYQQNKQYRSTLESFFNRSKNMKTKHRINKCHF
jgi:hypothetical protein